MNPSQAGEVAGVVDAPVAGGDDEHRPHVVHAAVEGEGVHAPDLLALVLQHGLRGGRPLLVAVQRPHLK